MTADGLSKARLARMHAVLAAHVESGRVPGLVSLVYRRGATHLHAMGVPQSGAAHAPMQRDSLFRIASMTKPITAVAAMLLIEASQLRLDDPVDDWLPELANPRVLVSESGPLDATEPARRPISVRDLLTFRAGIGFCMAAADAPIRLAIHDAGLAPGPDPPSLGPDEFMARLGRLPLLHQPGEAWRYHTASDVLGVLVARVTGQSFGSFLAERLFEPLGMHDTGFYVSADKLSRCTAAYRSGEHDNALVLHDPPDGRIARPPSFESGGGGLVSTADDYLAFARMLLQLGAYEGTRVLSRASVRLMMTNHLNDAQRAGAGMFLEEDHGWGFGGAICIRRDNLWSSPGRYGWDGGIGTSAYIDPSEDLIGILMTQRMLDSPTPPRVFTDFWTQVYQAIDD